MKIRKRMAAYVLCTVLTVSSIMPTGIMAAEVSEVSPGLQMEDTADTGSELLKEESSKTQDETLMEETGEEISQNPQIIPTETPEETGNGTDEPETPLGIQTEQTEPLENMNENEAEIPEVSVAPTEENTVADAEVFNVVEEPSEISAQLILDGYMESDLCNLPIAEIFHHLYDENGNPLQINTESVNAWLITQDAMGNVLKEEAFILAENKTIDLSAFLHTPEYKLEIIVGNGEKTNTENIHYNASVQITNILPEENEIAPMSLLPLEEVNAYLVLSDFTEEELKKVPLDTILNNLMDVDGNSIAIEDGLTTVWTYFKDENNNIIRDEYHVIDRDETVDMSIFADVKSYRMEMIIGSGQQLDPQNVRYLVKVYVSNSIAEKIELELYTESADGQRTQIIPERKISSLNVQLGIPCETTVFKVPNHVEKTEYYLGLSSLASEHPHIALDVYTLDEYTKFLMGMPARTLNDRILNQDMQKAGAGYKSTYDTPEDLYDPNATKSMFVMVYTDTNTGTVMTSSTQILSFFIKQDISYVNGDLFGYENEQMKDLVCYKTDTFDFDDLKIDLDSGSVTGSGVQGLYYMLDKGYPADGEYYLALNAHGVDYGDEANRYVVKAVEGLYSSLEEAANAKDIKESLLPVDKTKLPYGYKANYSNQNGGKQFTVFFEDGTVFRFDVRTVAYDPKYDEDYMESFTEAPIVGAKDPWFHVNGVQNAEGESLKCYIVENGKEINMDTMYGYGYQMVFINDPKADLTNIIPTFDVTDKDRVRIAHVNDKEYKEGTAIDCSDGPVKFTAQIKDKDGVEHPKNYYVTFIKKEKGPKLYVAGPLDPEIRSVFLDEYFEYKHDILIANLGDAPLTGLRVELDATNVKLDDYWTVGGEKNNTLAEFDTTVTDKEYGELPNLAKIRLLPDGEEGGEIEGTLKIFEDHMDEPVVINLSGRAQNPKITTTELDEGVRYVPYSHLVSTNNMYDWTNVEFKLDGTLPDGLEFISTTGEIYGVPQEAGTFTFTVTAAFTSDTYDFEDSVQEFVLNIKDNTNTNVYEATDENYELLDTIGTDAGGYDFVLTSNEDGTFDDEVFRSNGEFSNFDVESIGAVYLDGKELVRDQDYTAESGSTKITVRSQVFENIKNQTGEHTIAAEFRENGDRNNKLKRTAQNFRLEIRSTGENENPSITETPDEPSITGMPDNPSITGTPDEPSITGMPDNPMITGVPDDLENTDNSDTNISDKYVNCNLYFVDENEKPMKNWIVELQSDTKISNTDTNGCVRFMKVDFGKHEICLKKSNGDIVAIKEFSIREGDALNLSGNTITAKNGTTFTLQITYGNGELKLQSVTDKDAPRTGDNSTLGTWLFMMMSALIVVVIFAKRCYNIK